MASVNQDMLKKFKQLSLRQEADGTEVEVREDEEQNVKLQEIIELLVAAGYFRARIKGLSPFDKVVGGMTWCIESCNVDVDVDLLFQENSTIGQKIALTEKIVAVLPKLKCPHLIEPHQIQGLDFIHIFPVIQWLVKRSMEFRQEMFTFVRTFAIKQFNKEFVSACQQTDKEANLLRNVSKVSEVYRPHRYFKRKTTPPDDIESRVQVTLLEYGLKGVKQTSSVKNGENEDLVEEPEEHIEQLMNNMIELNETGFLYEDLEPEDRQKLEKHYLVLRSELEDGGARSKEQEKLIVLEEQRQLLVEHCKILENEKTKVEKQIAEETNQMKSIKQKKQEVEKSLQGLQETTPENLENVKEVEELVILNDSLCSQEVQFREHCKQELVHLQNLIKETRNIKTPEEKSTDNNVELKEAMEKSRILKLQLAKKNRTIAALQRQLDDVPSRAELTQYQHRFIELYNQVAAKHKETKQYYTLYNTLEDTRQYMKKEMSLLNSVSDSYPEAMQSTSGKEEFLKQFEAIVESVRQSKHKVDKRLNEEKQKRDQLSQKLHGLVELQRRYVTAVRQLGIECRTHKNNLAQVQRNN